MWSDDRIWQEWIGWLERAPHVVTPAHAARAYRAVLLGAGHTDLEADHALRVIWRTMPERTDGWRLLFNNLYASPTPGFSTVASPLLVTTVAARVPGAALDLASGQGRNAVHLAQLGWSVTAVDVSEVGLEIAAERALDMRVALETIRGSVASFDLGSHAWDLIVLTYAPVPVAESDFARRLVRSLRPDGVLVVESFASDRTASGRRPVDIDPAELRTAFADLTVEHFEDVVGLTEWDPEPTRLVRFVAVRS